MRQMTAYEMNNLPMIGQGLRVRSAADERDFRPPPRLLQLDLPAHRYWIPGPNLDQGSTSQCVEYSARAFLSASPIKNDPSHLPFGQPYSWMQRNDEWPGENYDGTSVHAAMRWLKWAGYIDRHEWAESIHALIAHLAYRAPAQIGSDWTLDMCATDKWGFIRYTGASVGGHAWVIRGYNFNKKDPLTGEPGVFRLRNSWGRGWGERGEAWITFADMAKLMDDPWVEVALPVELKVAGIGR